MDSYQKFISEKAKHKRELLGKMFFPRNPVLLLDFAEAKSAAAYEDLLEALDAIAVTTLVISKSERRAPYKNVHFMTAGKKSQAASAADLMVTFGSDITHIKAAGCVPVARLNGDSTVNYNPLQQKGNGFYFKNSTKWEVFAAIVRALETYQFPYDWENLVKEILA